MKRNVTGVRKDKFLMYPRFLPMILNARFRVGEICKHLGVEAYGSCLFWCSPPKKGTEKKLEGLIPLEKFGQFVETEDVVDEPVQLQPAPVNAAQINAPLNAMIAEEHDVQGVAEDEPETEVLTITSDDEGIEIMCDSGDDEELPLENEAGIAVSTVQPVISAENLALLLKSVTEKTRNPPSNLSVSNEESPSENPKDPDSLPLKRKRRDPRLGMYVEQNKDQPMNDAEDDDGLYDFDFEKSVTDSTTSTKDIFEFNADTQRIDLKPPLQRYQSPMLFLIPSLNQHHLQVHLELFMKSLVVLVVRSLKSHEDAI
ncbi:hypothetical protein Hdeb2414_s0706g00937821 [Helianthus debilis subsp. tardiflorus]